MPVVAIVGLKGGSGKSLAAISIAGELSRRGHPILLVDGDPHRAASRWVLESAEDILVDPLAGALLRPDCLFEHAERTKRITIVDTPSNDREVQWNAMMAADVVLVPMLPGLLASDALAPTIGLVEEAMTLRPWLRVGAFTTRAPKGARAADSIVPNPWRMNALLSERPDHERALLEACPIAVLAPRCKAAREVRALVDELETLLPPRAEVGSTEPRRSLQLAPLGEDDLDGWAQPTVFIAEEDVVGRASLDG